jgi:hypothetical protein
VIVRISEGLVDLGHRKTVVDHDVDAVFLDLELRQ